MNQKIIPLGISNRCIQMSSRSSAKMKVFGDATDSAYTVIDGNTLVNANTFGVTFRAKR